MLERHTWPILFALSLALAGACVDTDCETACRDEQEDCLDDPSDYDGAASCAASSNRYACEHAVCAEVRDRCLAQCDDDTSH